MPTTLSPDGRSRLPHLNTWRDGWRHLKFLLIYSPRWLYLIPGALLVLIGLALATLLVVGPLPISDNVILDLNSFAAACFMIVVGTQLLTFGAMARQFAARASFLPRTKRVEVLFGWLSTDRLVQIAAVLLLVGLVGLTWATWQWMKVDFGPLHSNLVPRVLVSSFCAIVIAIQTAASAFLMSVLDIPLRRQA